MYNIDAWINISLLLNLYLVVIAPGFRGKGLARQIAHEWMWALCCKFRFLHHVPFNTRSTGILYEVGLHYLRAYLPFRIRYFPVIFIAPKRMHTNLPLLPLYSTNYLNLYLILQQNGSTNNTPKTDSLLRFQTITENKKRQSTPKKTEHSSESVPPPPPPPMPKTTSIQSHCTIKMYLRKSINVPISL